MITESSNAGLFAGSKEHFLLPIEVKRSQISIKKQVKVRA